LARRDDLEALGFVMLYFYKGVLPWQNLPAYTRSDKYKRIKETKLATSLEDLCQGCPNEFLLYMKHNRELNFEEKPDYQMLIDMLKGLASKEGIILDYKNYDWVAKIEKIKRPIKAASPPLEEDEARKEAQD
jgi:casein kinase 1